ncbi:hypothetical protein [Arthrobacter sp. D1-17]
MRTTVKNPHAMTAHTTSDLLASLASRVLPIGRNQKPPVLVHSAWAGWHYETPVDEEVDAGTGVVAYAAPKPQS